MGFVSNKGAALAVFCLCFSENKKQTRKAQSGIFPVPLFTRHLLHVGNPSEYFGYVRI
jgi:hypothetical protein